MRALVTGATGFIGRHLVNRLVAEGAEVRCLTRRQPESGGPVEVVQGNYETGAGLREAVAGAEIVFHLAGVTKALCAADYLAGNARAAGNLAKVAGDVPRFVHVSSLAAAGPSADGDDLCEDDEPHPVSDYGRSKLEGELAVRRLLPRAVVIRPPVVYGPADTDVFEMLNSLAHGFDVRIGRGERWFSAIYVADLVDALLAAAGCPGAAGRTYFASHPDPVPWSEFAATAAKLLNRKPRTIVLSPGMARAAARMSEWWDRRRGKPGIISRDKLREAVYPRWTCSSERARRELGFRAGTSLETGLAQAIAWYREQRWL